MNTIEILELLSLAFLPLFIAWDLLRPHRRLRAQRGWRLRASIVTVLTFGLSVAVATLWGVLLGGRGLLDGARLGTLGGAVVGILVYELVHYAYHRAAHRYDPLWRGAHQMHHSAERLETLGANYLHPVDTFFFTTWSSLVFFPLLGLTAEAGVIATAFLAFNAAFQHANIRTPRWLGYIVQRPESHGVHH
ncbi:MAG: sterol desaturase family protein, partial [Candidatus Eiseniibacteriota bacterium]